MFLKKNNKSDREKLDRFYIVLNSTQFQANNYLINFITKGSIKEQKFIN